MENTNRNATMTILRVYITAVLSALVLLVSGKQTDIRKEAGHSGPEAVCIHGMETPHFSINKPESDFEKAMNLIMKTRSEAVNQQNIIAQQDYKNYVLHIPAFIYKSGTDKMNTDRTTQGAGSGSDIPVSRDYYIFALEKIQI